MPIYVGIPQPVISDERPSGYLPYDLREVPLNYYVKAVVEAGGTPLLLPVTERESLIENYARKIDRLLLVGGGDVHPEFYNELPSRKLRRVDVRRDHFEFSLLRAAVEINLPVLGICKGIQLIAVHFGGDLCQDMEDAGPEYFNHYPDAPTSEGYHSLVVRDHTLLHLIFGSQIRVNSFHHQAVRTPPHNSVVSATSLDGCIEAIELEEKRIIGVQWHPELMIEKHSEQLKMFQWLVDPDSIHAQEGLEEGFLP